MFTLEEIQEAILEHLQSSFVQPVKEQAIPDIESVPKTNGKVDPYLIVQFGDIYNNGRHAMSGAFDDDYALPVYVTSIAGEAGIARGLANKVIRVMLGATVHEWAGQIRKRPGGGMFSATASNSGTEAYAYPSVFRVGIQLAVLEP